MLRWSLAAGLRLGPARRARAAQPAAGIQETMVQAAIQQQASVPRLMPLSYGSARMALVHRDAGPLHDYGAYQYLQVSGALVGPIMLSGQRNCSRGCVPGSRNGGSTQRRRMR